MSSRSHTGGFEEVVPSVSGGDRDVAGQWEPFGAWPDDGQLDATVVASSPLAVLGLDPDRRVRLFNPAAVALTSTPTDAVLGHHVSVLFWPDDAPVALARIEAAIRGETGHLELDLRTADGTTVPVGISFSPLRRGGEVVGAVGVGRDIRARKRLEHDLAEAASSFEAFAEGSDIGMYRIEVVPHIRVQYVNPAFTAITGLTHEQLRVDPMHLARGMPASAQRHFERSHDEPGAVRWPIDFPFTPPEGGEVWVSVREVPIRDVDGRTVAVLGLTHDITAQRRQEAALADALRLERDAADRLRRVDELRHVFLQAVSHELRTPLTAVLGFSATLRDHADELDTDQLRALTGPLHVQASKLQRLLDDLLDIERLSRGGVAIERRRIDLSALVRDVLDELADPRIELVPPGPGHATGAEVPVFAELDPVKIERVVVNLLTNARRHAGPQARVRVTVDEAPELDVVRLEVEDDGPGVPAELRQMVFDPFEQGPGAVTSSRPGTGIGLTLVAEFARLHGGHASIDEGELGGARFLVELPSVAGSLSDRSL